MADGLLQLQGVRKHFGGVFALRGVSLEVREGEILGLIGPNGSGKSTLINVAAGYHRLDAGRIRFGGADITDLPPHRRAKMGLARTYQYPRPFGSMNVRDNVAVGALFGRREDVGAPRVAQRSAGQWLELLGLEAAAEKAIGSLTLQERRLLELARVLASGPRIILADEALAGLTPSETERVMEAIRRIQAMGVALLVVEHNVKAISALADRVVVLHEGKVLAEGRPGEVLQHERVRAAYLGGHAGDA
ncbi:MAG: ABC transporter ATP-binding protein [Armatimonadota bacterium]|nr:ABC transporter ATP-binding protein [Armatimonadota bacterium]MDR7484690.1 ABC transporter ATP-binding protein [Armatimonadota bacterium]MDR7520042.1 ABC transporter ATP-binding protein [Armatimonadota bacterium]MDR7550652.1 ABC transporter ATP-binding protein [Armatimonadota bacterium]